LASQLIKSRSDFERVLSETIRLVRRLNIESPGYPTFEIILRQLEAMAAWTASGRTPAQDERESIDIGLIAVRELDNDPDPRIQDLATRLHELNAYFEDWP